MRYLKLGWVFFLDNFQLALSLIVFLLKEAVPLTSGEAGAHSVSL